MRIEGLFFGATRKHARNILHKDAKWGAHDKSESRTTTTPQTATLHQRRDNTTAFPHFIIINNIIINNNIINNNINIIIITHAHRCAALICHSAVHCCIVSPSHGCESVTWVPELSPV